MPRLLGILEDHRTLKAVTEQVKYQYRRAANATPPFGTWQLSETLLIIEARCGDWKTLKLL